MEIIKHNFELVYFLLSYFIVVVLYHKVNVSYIYKKMRGVSITKRHKLLDCFPCFSFWVSLIASQSIGIAVACWLTSWLIDELKQK